MSSQQPQTTDEVVDLLREAVEQRDIDQFLALYAQNRSVLLMVRDARLTGLVTRLFEPMVLGELQADRVGRDTVERLIRATQGQGPVLVDPNIERALYAKARALGIANARRPLWEPPPAPRIDGGVPGASDSYSEEVKGRPIYAIQVQREVRWTGSFVSGDFRDSAGLSPRRSLARSPQELAFYRAVRMFWPQLHIQVNVPLDNFMEFPPTPDLADDDRAFMRFSRVDILMCTDELDPVAGFELDSSFHDDPGQQANDARKRRLFEKAGIPLISIRDASPQTVSADDFYDFLASDERLRDIRPRRIRTRRESHSMLVPL